MGKYGDDNAWQYIYRIMNEMFGPVFSWLIVVVIIF